MTKKSNLSLRFTRVWEKHCLKTAAATLLLCCVLPVQAKADTYKTQETASIQQQTVKTTGVIIDNTGEPLIGVSVKCRAPIPEPSLTWMENSQLTLPKSSP